MQKCQDLAGSSEKLFFRVLASLKLSVMTIKCIDDKTPILNWLLLSAASALPDERRKCSCWYWHRQCRSAPTQQCETLLRFSCLFGWLVGFLNTLQTIKLLNIKGTKASPGEPRCFGIPFRHTPHSALGQRAAMTMGSCSQATSGFSCLRRNVWPCVPAKRGLQKLADLI